MKWKSVAAVIASAWRSTRMLRRRPEDRPGRDPAARRGRLDELWRQRRADPRHRYHHLEEAHAVVATTPASILIDKAEAKSREDRAREQRLKQERRDAEYAAMLERQARERAALKEELERTRAARAWALTILEMEEQEKRTREWELGVLEGFQVPPRKDAH